MSDADLKTILHRLADSDNTAFDDLYKGYSKAIFGIALSVLKNAENSNDIVQLVMRKLLTMPKESFPSSHELTWLYTVTKNEALQFIRKEHLHIPLDGILDMANEADDLSHVIDMDTYRNMIKSLDEQSKTIVTLKVIAGFSHKEIGKLLHMPTGTVQWKYHMAVNKLRIALSNFILFILFGLWDIIYFLYKPNNNMNEGGVPDTPDIIFPSIDNQFIIVAVLALLSLVFSILFFIKSKKRQQNYRPDASK